MFTWRTLLLSSALACAIALPASAGLLSYDEAVDGELGFLTTTFALDSAGFNVIAGSSSLISPTFDNDSFFINLAPGLRIDSIAYSISNGTQTGGTGSYSTAYATQELETNSFLQQLIGDLTSNSVSEIVPSVSTPYEFATYRIWFGGSSSNGGVESASVDWRIEIETSEASVVPLPAGFLLLISGLGALGALRRTSRAAE